MPDLPSPTGPQLTYYARREAQERAAAERSADAGARRVHLQLADRYSSLSGTGTLQPA